jgi:membrane protein
MLSRRPDPRALAAGGYQALGRLFYFLGEHETFRAASAMAFDAFISVIPLLAVVGWALHRMRDDVAHFVAALLSAAPPSVSSALGAEFFRVDDGRALVYAPLGLLAFFWVSSSGVSTAMAVFETMFVCKPRPWWKRRIMALTFILVSIPCVTLTAAVGVLLSHVAGSLGGQIVVFGVPLLIVTAMVAAFFRLAIRRPPSVRRYIWTGAIATVVLWVVASVLFSVYVGSIARYATLYGNLANVAVLLLWLWLISISLLVGGEINAQLEGVTRAAQSER